ncbi:YoaK family protein [Variovorax sp. GrIS 2.14]|uniref:YoaK family protein n=1 Tax=Variovorax sp. GrIS 2.14 TaxID=3071709 RepID=UPI0038F692E3
MAFTAGAINACGLVAVQRYVSGLSGPNAQVTEALASEHSAWAFLGVGLIVAFVCGAATTGALVARAQRLHLQAESSHPLVLEAALLLAFGLAGANLDALGPWFGPVAAVLLSYVLGLQNAVVSHIAQTEITTTHITGVVTELGAELARWFVKPNAKTKQGAMHSGSDVQRLALYASVAGLFVGGMGVGAVAFDLVGYLVALPLAAVLLVLAAPAMLQDLQAMETASRQDGR